MALAGLAAGLQIGDLRYRLVAIFRRMDVRYGWRNGRMEIRPAAQDWPPHRYRRRASTPPMFAFL